MVIYSNNGTSTKTYRCEKFRDFHRYVKSNNNQIGIKQRGLDININNRVN